VSAVLDPSYPLFAYFVCPCCYFYFYPTLPHLPTKEWSLVFERCTDHANPIRVGASLKTSSSRTMWLCPTQIVNCHQRNFDAAHGFAPFSWTRFAFDGDGHGGWGIVGISDERRTRVCVGRVWERWRGWVGLHVLVQGTKPRPVPVLHLSDAGRLGTLAVRWRRGPVVRTVLFGGYFLELHIGCLRLRLREVWGGVGVCVTHAWGERSAAGG
jgi:hypothetical protein